MAYTEKKTLEMVQGAAQDMDTFYQGDFVNYRGKTKVERKEYYTEVIAKWCLEHSDFFELIRPITRKSSYKTAGHKGTLTTSNRVEENIAKEIFNQHVLSEVGVILDYQVPLKDVQTDKAGKIDLLAWDGRELRILELKRPGSKETILRSVLEGYTYLRTVDKAKLLKDFGLPAQAEVRACPLVFLKPRQWKTMLADRPNLKKLMEHLGCQVFLLSNVNGYYYAQRAF